MSQPRPLRRHPVTSSSFNDSDSHLRPLQIRPDQGQGGPNKPVAQLSTPSTTDGRRPVKVSELSQVSKQIVMESVDDALAVMGGTGREVFFEIADRRYGVTRADIIDSPGKLMSVLKLMFDKTARVFEVYALRKIKEKTGIEAGTLEEAVNLLREPPTAPKRCQSPTEEEREHPENPIEEFLESNVCLPSTEKKFTLRYRAEI